MFISEPASFAQSIKFKFLNAYRLFLLPFFVSFIVMSQIAFIDLRNFLRCYKV